MPTDQDFAPKVQVFEPHRASLPPLIPYIKEFWRRRVFAIELARFNDKAEYLDSRLGKVWLVLNPLHWVWSITSLSQLFEVVGITMA